MFDRAIAAKPLRAAVLAALIACLMACAAATLAHAEGAVVYQSESLGQYQSQLAAGEVAAVTINKRARALHITLKNGRHVLIKVPPKQVSKYEEALRAKGIAFTVLTPAEARAEGRKKPVHHKLRYIAAGVLVAVLVIIGLVLFLRRRHRALSAD